jgi:hypothetical protein
MSGQEIAVLVIGVVAAGYLLVRYLRRRASANCCGEKECPAAKQTVRDLSRRT